MRSISATSPKRRNTTLTKLDLIYKKGIYTTAAYPAAPPHLQHRRSGRWMRGRAGEIDTVARIAFLSPSCTVAGGHEDSGRKSLVTQQTQLAPGRTRSESGDRSTKGIEAHMRWQGLGPGAWSPYVAIFFFFILKKSKFQKYMFVSKNFENILRSPAQGATRP